MKKYLLSLFTILTLSAYGNQLLAQQTNRDMRREANRERNQALDAQLSQAIQDRDFQFQATQIIYGQSPALQNIQLMQLYFVTVAPDFFRVYLPLYGPNNFNGQPSIMHRLDFFVNKYKCSVEQTKNGGSDITVTATDPWSINTYTFFIRATPNGNESFMSVQTPFVGAVTYNGVVQTR